MHRFWSVEVDDAMGDLTVLNAVLEVLQSALEGAIFAYV